MNVIGGSIWITILQFILVIALWLSFVYLGYFRLASYIRRKESEDK